MNLQSLVVVILRLAALKFLITTGATFLPQLIVAEPYSFVYILIIAALITGAFMLWSLAHPIAQRITSGLPLELSFGALSRVDCYSITFLGVGAWLVAVYFSQVLNWSHYLFRIAAVGEAAGEESFSQVNGYDVSNSIIPFVIGIVLFLNGRKWAHRVAARDERIEKLLPQEKPI